LNQLILTATLTQKSVLRFTPTGLPAVDVVLEHESNSVDTGVPRQVALTLKAVAFGATAEVLAKAEIGKSGQFSGFLNNARGGRGTSFHIQTTHF
jgi:primosomal replication protein N